MPFAAAAEATAAAAAAAATTAGRVRAAAAERAAAGAAAAYVAPGVSFPSSNTDVRPSQLTEEQQTGGAGRGAGRRWTHCCLWPTPVKLLTLSPACSRNHQRWRKSSFPEGLNDETLHRVGA